MRNAGRTVNDTRFDAAVIEGLYAGRAGWKGFGDALARAEDGDASTLLAMADGFVGRTASGMEHDALDAFWAISCLDGPLVGDVDAAARLQALATQAAPRLGAFLVNFSLACSIWPVPPVTAPAPLDAAGAPPLLVVGTTGDPATPLVSARSLARSSNAARCSSRSASSTRRSVSGTTAPTGWSRGTSSTARSRVGPSAAEPVLYDSFRSFQICSAGHRRAQRRSHP